MTSRPPEPTSLRKIARTRLSDQAALEIKRLIAAGAHPPGTRLPTEVELADRLGVTRLTVREALVQLEATGFTATRHGSGTYVNDIDDRGTFGLRADMLSAGRDLSADEAVDLMEFRAKVILAFAEPMAKRRATSHVEELEGIVRAERAVKGDAQALAELDYRFNEILAQASGNLFYAMLMRSLREIHVHLGAIIFRELRDDAAIIATHEAITAGLRSKSAAKLRRALDVYLTGGTEVVTRALKK